MKIFWLRFLDHFRIFLSFAHPLKIEKKIQNKMNPGISKSITAVREKVKDVTFSSEKNRSRLSGRETCESAPEYIFISEAGGRAPLLQQMAVPSCKYLLPTRDFVMVGKRSSHRRYAGVRRVGYHTTVAHRGPTREGSRGSSSAGNFPDASRLARVLIPLDPPPLALHFSFCK